ncbi:MAG: hypothetical protein AAF441_24700 [Pseudomonadota bacterium]
MPVRTGTSLNIMVCGGYDEDQQDGSRAESIAIFGQQLACQVARQGHTLVCGNLTSFDKTVIEAACDEISDEHQCLKRVKSWRPLGSNEFTNRGAVFNSKLPHWNEVGPVLRYPEPIEHSDVVILVGGWEGTHTAATWAKLANKPILPVASYGEAAAEIYDSDRDLLPSLFGRKADSPDFDVLNTAVSGADSNEAKRLAKDVVSLAERMALSRDVFIIMSYGDDPSLEQAVTAFEEVCDEFGFNAKRLDQEDSGGTFEVNEAITDRIRDSAFVIVDLTEERPNVYYELGYARALGKDVILTAKEGTTVHFDAQGLNRINWTDFLDLRAKLRPAVGRLAGSFGA